MLDIRVGDKVRILGADHLSDNEDGFFKVKEIDERIGAVLYKLDGIAGHVQAGHIVEVKRYGN